MDYFTKAKQQIELNNYQQWLKYIGNNGQLFNDNKMRKFYDENYTYLNRRKILK